jgi:opacity protein-like surface antigen
MKKLVVAASLLALIPAWAVAQSAVHPPGGQGYVFVGGGNHQMTPTVGFGGEAYARNGLGGGIEIGVADLTIPITGDSNTTLGLGSADLSYHFFPKKPENKAAPFVSGGYTLFFGHNAIIHGPSDFTTSGFNLGGGVDVFAARRLGARLEVRYFGHGGRILHYTFPDVDQFNFVAFRIALTFR